jgi:serine/threonine protein kinase
LVGVSRDLKLANIFLTSSGVVKLGDLGISRAIGTGGNAMTACGTPHNMSPEIFAEKPYGKKTDIWSLGCILCELLTLHVRARARDRDGDGGRSGELVGFERDGEVAGLTSHVWQDRRHMYGRIDVTCMAGLASHVWPGFGGLGTHSERP